MIFTKPVPNRMAQTGVRSGFYRGMVGPLPDPCLFRITEAYAKFNIEDRPLVTTMNMRPDKPLVESAFGLVQEGSVLSYQQPVLTTRYITLHRDAPPTPHLPLEGYDILPSDCVFVCSEEELLHLKSLSVTLEMAHKIEEATREQSSSSEWHQLRRPRVTASRFREVCHVRGQSSFGLVEFKCPNVQNFIDCKYVQMECGTPKLKKSHAYYWQVQGQLLISGMQWCDFVVWAQEDYLVQRIYMDTDVHNAIREKADYFFFLHIYAKIPVFGKMNSENIAKRKTDPSGWLEQNN
ncbi:thyroid hormone receptor alpha [Sarotherodon galilaeus]